VKALKVFLTCAEELEEACASLHIDTDDASDDAALVDMDGGVASAADLAEAREVERWVEDMTDLAMAEEQHLICLALQSVAPDKLKRLHAQYNVMPLFVSEESWQSLQSEYTYDQPTYSPRPLHESRTTAAAQHPRPWAVAAVGVQHRHPANNAAASCTQHKSCAARGGPCLHRMPRACSGDTDNGARHPRRSFGRARRR